MEMKMKLQIKSLNKTLPPYLLLVTRYAGDHMFHGTRFSCSFNREGAYTSLYAPGNDDSLLDTIKIKYDVFNSDVSIHTSVKSLLPFRDDINFDSTHFIILGSGDCFVNHYQEVDVITSLEDYLKYS